MSPALLLPLTNSSMRKQLLFVFAVVVVIVSLPVMAVFALGTSVLSVLDSGSSSGYTVYEGPLSKTDTYEWGNCTYWVSLLRQQANDPIPNTWGNASTWADRAADDGYLVDDTPSANAIMQISNVDHGLGHVAYVQAVDPTTGDWTISEMNVKGLDLVDTQTLPAKAAGKYNFIHDKLAGL